MREIVMRLQALCEAVDSIKVSPVNTDKPVNREIVSKYVDRFKMFKEDGVPAAIYDYMDDLFKHDYGELTVLEITEAALNILREEGNEVNKE